MPETETMREPILPDQTGLRRIYDQYAEVRSAAVRELRTRIEDIFSGSALRPVMVKARLKDFPSFFKKYIRMLKAGDLVFRPVITDLVGVRVICPFIEDLDAAEETVRRHFEVLECERKGSGYSFKEFGYESTHLLIRIPADITEKTGPLDCESAELQIRTILQDAWAEVEHELVYKAEFTPFDDALKRKLAAVNASLSLADTIFQEICSYQRRLNGELEKRRESFFRKIEESTDALLFSEEQKEKTEKTDTLPPGPPAFAETPLVSKSMDDLLLNALFAHNKGRFDEASGFYSRILEMSPGSDICALVYKHRGMAYFARSMYTEAIEDFTRALEMDGASYKAAYYRGVVRSVILQYAGAVDDFTLSLRINPYQPFCLFRRGQAYYHLGDYPAALADAEASLALEPESVQTKKFRELLHEKLKM
ncbi:MAG: tetratricopeptide repeat protein [Treponema sp.]|jgi:putative GTP pyrophosphokinase|nr:tetratricopeptide repeat protein [Treponema sp.]